MRLVTGFAATGFATYDGFAPDVASLGQRIEGLEVEGRNLRGAFEPNGAKV